MRCFSLLSVALIATSLSAQDTGRLSGSVVDPSGSAVPNVKVLVFLAGGSSPVLSGVTTKDGLFNFASVRYGLYDLTAEAAGFQKLTMRGLKVDPGRETSLPALSLEIGTVTEAIEIKAITEGVQTTNAEISTTITNEHLSRLPLLDRSAASIIYTQAGVAVTGGATTINGQRTSYSNITFDGINIQDNAIRSNSLDYQPNRLFTDQVAEVTIVTSNANTAMGGGATQVTFVAPAGSNQFHGGLRWDNRNNIVSANTWFNNKDGIERPFLNRNQFGGSFGGPIVRDKLLFYVDYEGYRLREQATADRMILTSDARNGIFTYQVAGGEVRRANLLQLRGVSIDPVIQGLLDQVPGPERINNFRVGDSRPTLLRNTGGYSFLVRSNTTRDNVTGKLDYILSTRHTFYGSFAWNRDVVDRPDTSNDFSPIPKVTNDDARKLLSLGWRWNPTSRLTNEMRGGFNLAPGSFLSSEKPTPYLIAGLIFSNPINAFQPEARITNTYNLQNNAGYMFGRHNFNFGYQQQNIRLKWDIAGGVLPTYLVAIGLGNPGLTASQLPGISALEFSRANAMLATLAGYVSDYDQSFNVTSRTSGFVPGAPLIRNYTLDNYALYFQDAWKLKPRLTLTLGVRWDYLNPVDESNGLALMPVVQNNNPIATLLSNATLDFHGKTVGRPFYQTDRNNFSPHVALAWDLFGTGRTSLRAGYSVSYVNDDVLISLDNIVNNTNAGLIGNSFETGLRARLSTNLPRIPVPPFKVPRTTSDNYDLDVFNAQALIDPGLVTPYVQQYSFGLQHEWKNMVFEGRYVGNHATKTMRSFDYNQVVIRENGFLDDFRRAQNNLRLALQRNIASAAYNPSIPGSQPLAVFPRLEEGGFLNHPVIVPLIQTGQVGELATVYQTNEINGTVNFFRNRFALGTNMMTNYSNSTYNALVLEVRRRFNRGLALQVNYVFSKVLSDAAGVSQFRFEPFLDLNNAGIERARAPFDLTHQFKANWTYDLPFGPGHRISAPHLGLLLGGWSVSGILGRFSGLPFSIVSARGTLNRGARSAANTAITTLNKSQLDQIFQLRMTGDGPYFAAASVIGQDGRAVAADGEASFQGQAFFHPGAGELGSLQRRMFSGPWLFDMDVSLQKETHIKERHLIQFRVDAFSVLNHPNFFVGGWNIDSENFGRVADVLTARRTVQFALKYKF